MKVSEYKETLRSEWRTLAFHRDLLAEFVGTFMLVSVQVALPLTWDKENMGTVVQVSLCMGFVVSTMAWTLGDFSGGHFNPAVSFAMLLLTKITIVRAVFYVGVQCAAGVAGAAWVNLVTPTNLTESLGATMLHPDMESWQGYLVETWITLMLVMTILGSTNSLRKKPLYMPPIIIGMAITMGIAVGFNSTGGSMNPARSLGPAAIMDLANGDDSFWENHWVGANDGTALGSIMQHNMSQWIYWAGPFTGASLAALIYSLLLDQVDRPSDENDDDGGYTISAPTTTYINQSFSEDKQ